VKIAVIGMHNGLHYCLNLGVFAKLGIATNSFVVPVSMSVSVTVCASEYNKSSPTGRIFMKFGI
jgi:hypothetical protein